LLSDGLLSDDELDALRAKLPPAPRPQGGYVPAVTHGPLVQTAGMTPRVDGVLQYAGQVGADLTVAQARAAAAIAAENALSAALAAAQSESPDEWRFDRVLHLRVYVHGVAGFGEHSAVADGASERLSTLLGSRADAARVAVGVASLPQGAAVEVELTCSRVGRR
jgi:enamine deaminase RidA (YjgF/YER057c/UK114 family)